MAKATYGTGGFILLNTGATPIRSQHGLLTTIAYQWGGVRHYALEGSIFSAGRDGAMAARRARDHRHRRGSRRARRRSRPGAGVYLVPAFAGLGAPHWRSDARGAVIGLDARRDAQGNRARGAGKRRLSDRDLLAAMTSDFAAQAAREVDPVMRVDGGMAASDWTMQFLADMLDAPVDRPAYRRRPRSARRSSPAGAPASIPGPRNSPRIGGLDRRFAPAMERESARPAPRGWRDAVARDAHRR